MGKWHIMGLVLLIVSLLAAGCSSAKEEGDPMEIVLAVAPGVAYTPDELQQAAENVGRRLDGLHVKAEIAVDNDQIVVTLTGTQETETLVREAAQRGVLEFVDFSMSDVRGIEEGACILTTEQVELAEARLPAGAEPLVNADYTCERAGMVPETALLDGRDPFQTIMTGAGLKGASVMEIGVSPQYVVTFELKSAGDRVDDFIAYIANNANRPMGIVLDGRVLSNLSITAELSATARADTLDGGVISGNFTKDEARVLVAQLKSGALPLPLVVVSVSSQ